MMCRHQSGFTLVEMIMVITITGILGGIVAVFLKAPVQGYVDTARRADMTDIADTALRRIGRDLRLALPNSVRVTSVACGASTCSYLEFLPTKGGGRYRADVAPSGTQAGCGSLAADVLDFAVADGCFEVLGPMPVFAANDRVVVYNLGVPGSDAYTANTTNDNTGLYAANPTATTVTLNPAKQFPFASPGHRFQVIDTPVTYACAPAAGGAGGALTRWQGYAIQSAQPTTLPTTGTPSSSVLANNVSACTFTYDVAVVAQRSGLVTMRLGITEKNPGGGDETVTLYNATHVSNVP